MKFFMVWTRDKYRIFSVTSEQVAYFRRMMGGNPAHVELVDITEFIHHDDIRDSEAFKMVFGENKYIDTKLALEDFLKEEIFVTDYRCSRLLGRGSV